tara:strand:+ start:1040 stop:1396 length:357 start_codon:yes stop_codon:yes gene_type:complete
MLLKNKKMKIGYPDTKNKLGGTSPLYNIDPDYKEGDSMSQDDFEQMTGEDGNFHHGALSQQASKIKKDKKGQYILSDSGYSDVPKDTIRPPSGSVFKKFKGKDVYNRKEQRKLYFPKK